MKRYVVYILLILVLPTEVVSQDIYQQTTIELNDVFDDEKSYLCQATSSIELLPGFSYAPTSNNEMSLSIDRYSVYPPSDGVYGGNDIDENCVVGSIPGVLNVGSTGAANYSIDIQLPQALGGMTPKLSMAYNSQSANGLLGWSWDLIGLSSIERVGQTEYHDGKFTGVDFVNDRYAIDGQRLMTVGDNEYKTEIDNFDKIVSYKGLKKGPDYFVVWKSDGTIWEYGCTEDSKVEPQGNDGIVLKWLLNKISDRNGNAILYEYYENNSTGESYVKNIKYTSNENAGIKPAYNVMFQYDERSDVSVGYINGSQVTDAKVISKIEVLNNYSGKKMIEYSLEYDEPGSYDDNYYMHYRLKSIRLTIDGVKVNPTQIVWNSKDKWNDGNPDDYKKYELDKRIFNKVSFVGDFNGDGFSDVLLVPYKVQNVYASDIEGEVYLNNGDGSFAKEPVTKVAFSKNLEWIYVCDIDGDGKDDIVPYEVHYDSYGNFESVRFTVRIMANGSFINRKLYVNTKAVSLLPCNWVDKDKCGLLILETYDGKKNKDLAKCIYFKNGELVIEDVQNSNTVNGKNINCMAMDISGDGMGELLSLDENGYKVYRINNSNGLWLEDYCSGNDLTSKIYPFPNDYNGDGKMDLLYYDSSGLWSIVLSTGTSFTSPTVFLRNNLFQNVRLNEKDRYRYSLQEMQKPTIAIRTADFDGDGTADVGVFNNSGGNYYLQIGFSPYKKDQSSYSFLYYKRYYMPINYSHQTIQLGRFFPQDNVSILSALPRNPSSTSKAYVVSLYPNSKIYSVEKIMDGMGNVTELSYDYLIANGKNKDGFYTCSGNVDNYKVARKSVPILALKEHKTYNINGKPVVVRYNYHNALVHKRGHGFVGFERIDARNYIDDNLVGRVMREYSLEPLGSYCIPLLTSEKHFHGENQLIKEHYFEYKMYSCNKNAKVIIPLPLQDREAVFDVDKKAVVLKNIITVNTYESDVSSDNSYGNLVRLKKTMKGFDNIKTLDPGTCQYFEEMSVDYADDISNWIINRPKKIVKCVGDKDNDIIGDVCLMEYDGVNPMRLVKETMIPNVNADANDSLTIVNCYKYDVVGNVIESSISSPSLKNEKVIKSEYGINYKYRYKTKSIDEIGREVVCKYDDNFGILKSTIDHNNKITRIENKPFGVESTMLLPDGMKTVKVLRWSENNKYAPENSSYYCWEKSVGKAESMVFYHKSGCELRTVTFDINGKAVIVDKEYDDFGNLKRESYPYYENEDKLFVSNVYDSYNRIVETAYPGGNKVSYMYDGNNVHTESVTAEALKKYSKASYNVMGWMTSIVDNGGNEVEYEYYSDGKLKSAQIGENKLTRISVTYDNRGNRASVYDPNCGKMSYKYDALGNLRKVSNEQYAVEMEYDVLGRMMVRKESDLRYNKRSVVRWEYSCSNGYDGLLNCVTSSKGHQIEYAYDNKFRLKYKIETIMGKKYKTDYSYDEANRVSSISYPSGLCVSKKYSNSGYERMVCDDKTGTVLWKTDKTNSNGCITECQFGNGLKSRYSYNPYSGMLEKIETNKDDISVQNLSYSYDGIGNMLYRCDANGYNCEEFEYDCYDRLTKIILNGDVKGKTDYCKNGNISKKEADGVNVLYNAIYAIDKPNAILSANSDDEKMYERFGYSIEYSTYDNVVAINAENKSLSINYGCDNNRIFMRSNVGGKVKTKAYVGNCEYIEEDGVTTVLTYLEGPMGVFAVHVNDGDESINYIHKDNLGSWSVITDEDGRVLWKLSFDAWGNMRDPEKWEDDADEMSMLYDRGFTGHEHLCGFGLINMNGRLYDPLISMMLSPDNNIQMPQSSQNFNRYSYCLNNPLKYNDPSGEFVESIAFGIVGGAANLVLNARNIDSFGEAALLFGVGFVKGFLTEITVGQSWFLQVGVGAVIEGVISGVNCMVSIGDGNFDFGGDDWNSVKSASHYGLGSGLVKSFMYTYMTEPTDEQYGISWFETSYHRELSHGITSLVAHGMGCWFSDQPFLSSMKFKDVGFDLKMLGIIARRLMSSYVNSMGFGEEALDERAREIKKSILDELLTEIPDHPDFEYTCELLGVFVEDFRLYVVGNVFQMLPGEMLEIYPKPYMEEVITFPFSYSLFKTLFFNKQ